jgi:enediyne polyketide synthase
LGEERYQLAVVVSREAKEDFDIAATRVWTAIESRKKAGAGADAPIVLRRVYIDGWVALASGCLLVATGKVPMGLDRVMVVAIAIAGEA